MNRLRVCYSGVGKKSKAFRTQNSTKEEKNYTGKKLLWVRKIRINNRERNKERSKTQEILPNSDITL